MKKLKIVITVLLIIASVVVFGVIIGRQFLINKLSDNSQINDAVEKIDTIINDENTKAQVNAFVQQLVDDGVLNEQQIDKYVKGIEEDPELSININGKVVGQNDNNASQSADKNVEKSKKTGNTEETKSVKSLGKSVFFGDFGKSETAQQPGEAESEQPEPSEKPKSKTERILSAMTPAEASFAMSVYSRVSVSEVMALMKTDKAAAKKYVTDRLSSDEISRALSIYSKYSHLLKE